MFSDTIVAISTAPGEAGIGIIRMSGDQSVEILKRRFRLKSGKFLSQFEPRRIYYGIVTDLEEHLIDEAIVFFMRGPHSYTAEDVVEIQCHGGMVAVRKIMETVLLSGARLAEAGEFTKRAFLNGRIDLSQAEAVMDVISAKSERGLRTAIDQLEGELSKEVHQNIDLLLDALSNIEASIDFPEHDIEDVTEQYIKDRMLLVQTNLISLIDSFRDGKIIKDGLATAIVGKPNVGKSSLLNMLLKQNRAIVTDIPGTTRDIIEEYIYLDSILLKLTDTAGIHDTDDLVEQLGVERTIDAIEQADLILFVCDISNPLSDEDFDIINKITEKKVIAICNKIDCGIQRDVEILRQRFGKENVVEMSVIEKRGLKDLEHRIRELVFHGNVKSNYKNTVTSLRHKNLLEQAYQAIQRVLSALDQKMPVDLLSVDIQDAWTSLGKITGDTVSEDIIHEIFTKFCIGK